ncbi:MAG TPA: hypothetical protein VHG71_04365 [Verrucomicrobiae bacterium]|nr:hypothetical protein [Verrucomicrobiae bacterium]
MSDEDLKHLGSGMVKYCTKFDVPLEFLFVILEDQKVTPMIRGKAMEYNAYLLLKKLLPRWGVEKLNLNPQPGTDDEDISITYLRTGQRLAAESKSAVRGSMSDGERTKIIKGEPHFKVKCHRSRSNKSLETNDAYAADSFDVLITNPLNAIYVGATLGEDLEVIKSEKIRKILNEFYKVTTDEDLIKACSSDWRFCIPSDIAVDGFIPRTPYVKLMNDPYWKPLAEIESRITQIATSRRR